MAVHEEFVKNNAEYVATFGDKGALPLKPGKKLAIGQPLYCTHGSFDNADPKHVTVTCMDARLK